MTSGFMTLVAVRMSYVMQNVMESLEQIPIEQHVLETNAGKQLS